MSDLLIKLFVKDYQQPERLDVRKKFGTFAALVGIVSNIILFIAKFAIGILFHSVAIMADAVNNLMDSASSIITLVGFKLAAKPADEDHPYGHARYEAISALIVAFIIILVGVQFIQTSWDKIQNPVAVHLDISIIIILIMTIVIKLWQAAFNKKVGKTINSNSLIATALDSRNDVLVTLTVLLGGLLETYMGIKIDGYVGLALSIFIIYSGIQSIKETIDELLGQMPSWEEIKDVEDILNNAEGILGFHDIMMHNYGYDKTFASVHVEVDAKQDIMKTHEAIDKIEDEFLRKLNINMVIHQDPVVLDDPHVRKYRFEVANIIKEYNNDFTYHDFRLINHYSYNQVSFDLVVSNGNKIADNDIIEAITNKILVTHPADRITIIIDRNYISARRVPREK